MRLKIKKGRVMLRHVYDYCNHFNYDIENNIIYRKGNAIGHVNLKEEWVIIGNNKLKYGDFAVLIMEGYFDILGRNNDYL